MSLQGELHVTISAQHLVYCLVYFALLSLSASNELSPDAALNLQPTG
jgi:hypothetical protein